MAQFCILLGSSIFISPKIDKDEPLAVLFKYLKVDSDGPAQILANARIDDCKFYSITTPVSARGSPEEVEKACLDASNTWVHLERTDLVGNLVQDEKYLTAAYVCLVVEPPQARQEKALYELKKKQYSALFESLQIVLNSVESWSRDDVLYNLKGGSFWSHGECRTVSAITELESSLAAKRGYFTTWTKPDGVGALDFQTASIYSDDLKRYFVCTNTRSCVVRNTREFVAFFAVLRSHKEDAERVSDEPSSACKANYVSSHFFVPPFFSCQPQNSETSFKVDMPWKFPIMLATREKPSSWGKTTPKSGFSVISADFLCPFMLCEVASDQDERDRWRMLVQAIAAARVGYHLKKSHSQHTPFFVVAIYVRANLTAERYIVTQTNSNGKVFIAQTNHDLLQSDQALEFLREMFNLQEKIETLARDLDDAKGGGLQTIEQVARDLPSLSKQRDAPKTTRTINSIQEDSREYAKCARQTPFTEDPEIADHLNEMGYRVDMVLFGFEHVVMISRESNEFDRGFLKVSSLEREVEILQYLARIDAPDNHTVPGVQVWTRSSGGFVIYMSSGGGHLTALRQVNEKVWSAATQLVEGVAFMHKHGVAHRDIKPSNVLIPPDGGRLSIIDFSIALFVHRSGIKSHGIVGTEEYMAPEIWAGDGYDVIRADLWSCGKTLAELCSLCSTSVYTTFIVDVSRELMAIDPLQRPTMSEVLDRMAAFELSLSESHPRMSLATHLVAAEARS